MIELRVEAASNDVLKPGEVLASRKMTGTSHDPLMQVLQFKNDKILGKDVDIVCSQKKEFFHDNFYKSFISTVSE